MLLLGWLHHSLLHTQTFLGQVGSRENSSHHRLCTAHLNTFLCRFPLLHGIGAYYLGIGDIERRWHLLKKLRCWDVSSMSSLHEWKKFVNSHQALRWTQRYRGLTEAVRTMGQAVSKPRPDHMWVGKPEPYAPGKAGKDFDDWDFPFNGYAGTLDPTCPALLKTAKQSPTVVMATPPHEQQSTFSVSLSLSLSCWTLVMFLHSWSHHSLLQ